MQNLITEALELIEVVVRDTQLTRFARQEAKKLVSLAAAEPELVWDRLEALRGEVVSDLPLWPPDRDYARCVSVEAFWRHHLAARNREYFRNHEHYRRHLESQANPSAVARSHLSGSLLVPAPHSWLIPVELIAGLNGAQTRSRLQIEQKPPYLVMIFPMPLMEAAGVRVREPRGLDAVPGRFLQWSSGDVVGERIDEDIPLKALGNLQWRP